MTTIQFELDGDQVEATVDPGTPLRDVLRDQFDKTGVKAGCLSGRCGVCTVHIEGTVVKSCLVMAPKVDGKSVTTISAIADSDGEGLHEIQEAFVDHFASQCGYCTPGFIMSAIDYLDDDPSGDRDEIRAALKGNVCRCTGYEKILNAVEDIATSSD